MNNTNREWLANKWTEDIRGHNRYYDPTSLIVNVEASVAALTDKEVDAYVAVLKALQEGAK